VSLLINTCEWWCVCLCVRVIIDQYVWMMMRVCMCVR